MESARAEREPKEITRLVRQLREEAEVLGSTIDAHEITICTILKQIETAPSQDAVLAQTEDLILSELGKELDEIVHVIKKCTRNLRGIDTRVML